MKPKRDNRLADAPLEDCVALEYILLGDLRDLLEEPADRVTRQWISTILDALLQMMPREWQLKDEDGGYLASVVERFPNWDDQVQQLRAERRKLFVTLGELRSRMSRNIPFHEVVEQLRIDLRQWMSDQAAHTRHERRILQSAFNLDVGCGD